jgi:hypothetical protein
MPTLVKEAFDHDICTACGGKCCKGSSCIAHPSDFGDNHSQIWENVKLALASGMWIFEYWDGDCPGLPDNVTGYFLCPRSITSPKDILIYPSLKGQCMFLEETGCPFPDESRPMGARTLEPGIDRCTQHAVFEGSNDKPLFCQNMV